MNQVLTAINLVTKPIHDIFVKAFNANKYVAGIGFSSVITLTLFFVMVRGCLEEALLCNKSK